MMVTKNMMQVLNMDKTYTEQDIRKVALRCIGFMVGQLDQLNKTEILDSEKTSLMSDRGIEYMDKVINDMNQHKYYEQQ